MLVDALTHLNDPRVLDAQELVARAERAGISHVVSAGVDPVTDPQHREFSSGKVSVWKAYGIHPSVVSRHHLRSQVDALRVRLSESQVVAIGEIGLDARPAMPPMQIQLQTFESQIELAAEFGLPIIIHCVRCPGKLLETLARNRPLPAGGMWHGYNGSQELVSQIEKAGLHVSFGGVLTYQNAKKCRASAVRVSSERLLIESGTPDSPPAKGRDQFSEPASMLKTLQTLAALRGESSQQIAKQTSANAEELFKFSLRQA